MRKVAERTKRYIWSAVIIGVVAEVVIAVMVTTVVNIVKNMCHCRGIPVQLLVDNSCDGGGTHGAYTMVGSQTS